MVDFLGGRHPRVGYVECLRDASFWHRYIKTDQFGPEDMAMWACKDIGCSLNFYAQMKMVKPDEKWQGSRNAMDEGLAF